MHEMFCCVVCFDSSPETLRLATQKYVRTCGESIPFFGALMWSVARRFCVTSVRGVTFCGTPVILMSIGIPIHIH